MKYAYTALIVLVFCTSNANAEFERPDLDPSASKFLVDEKTLSQAKTGGGLSVKQARPASKSMATGSANVAPSKTTLKDHQFDKRKLLRCWQYGQLIVAENGYQSPGPSGQTILTKGASRMTGFDFGDTFCLYLGG